MRRRRFPCPRCNRTLTASGVAVVTGPDGTAETLAVFQCDECIDQWEMEPGKFIPCAFTFALDRDGRALDPETGEAR